MQKDKANLLQTNIYFNNGSVVPSQLVAFSSSIN